MVEPQQHANPLALTLTGFVGDYRGGKDALLGYRPVVVRDDSGQRYVAMREDWSLIDLLELSVEDSVYVHSLPERPIAPGSLVWLAGQTMVNRSSDLEPGITMKTWESFTYEYRFQTGSRDKLAELSTQLFQAAVRKLHAALFDQEAVRAGSAQRFFRIIDNLAYAPAAERQLQRALYFFEMREMARYEMVTTDMVLRGDPPQTAGRAKAPRDALRVCPTALDRN